MLGNFGFMRALNRVDDYRGFTDECDQAEYYCALGEYETSVIWSRKAIELIVRWIYESPDFGMPTTLYGKSALCATHSERLSHSAFAKWLCSSNLLSELDYARICGNDAAHNHAKIDNNDALRCLECVFNLMMVVEQRLWEEPYVYDFFEPTIETDTYVPLERNYPALIDDAQQNGDAEMAAKWALLYKVENKEFDISPYYAALEGDCHIKKLILTLSDRKQLRKMLLENAAQLSVLISKCYHDFDWREAYAVTYMATKACRSVAALSAEAIKQCMNDITAELEALKNG